MQVGRVHEGSLCVLCVFFANFAVKLSDRGTRQRVN